jgi:hypothetical protein
MFSHYLSSDAKKDDDRAKRADGALKKIYKVIPKKGNVPSPWYSKKSKDAIPLHSEPLLDSTKSTKCAACSAAARTKLSRILSSKLVFVSI